MASILKNKFVTVKDGVNFSRSLFPYEKRHTTNMLAGYIVPVHTQFMYPGVTPDWRFGCSVEAAPLISTNMDNIYIDIVSIWCPLRLVMVDFNEWLGESHSVAFTINRNVTFPKLTKVDVKQISGNNMSRAYYAEHFIGPHVGFRTHEDFDLSTPNLIPADSEFAKGISVIPSRIYELNWNTFFRNENIQTPILIDKTSAIGSNDANYAVGLGRLQLANKLKTFYTVCTPSPSLLDVSLALGEMMPVGFVAGQNETISGTVGFAAVSGNLVAGEFVQGITSSASLASGNVGLPIIADLSSLTVNKMYYALMLQRYANKMMKGRRAVEFYENFFGIKNSDAGHDMPTLLCHKRYPINMSQVIATASGSNGTETTDLGQKGAFSTTGFGDVLVKNFTSTEHGYIHTYAIIRGQPSLSTGIGKDLSIDSVLDTYLTTFDHIGPVGIERLEILDPNVNQLNTMYGYTNAWYNERNQVSDVVGIAEPGQPLEYKTLALSYQQPVISNQAIAYFPQYMDRIFLFPVCYAPSTEPVDSNGEPLNSNRYQFLIQFVVKGKFAAVMSPDSEPLKLRL